MDDPTIPADRMKDAELASLRILLARAERALTGYGFVDLGAQEWKPPVNKVAGKLQRQVFDLERQLGERERQLGDLETAGMSATVWPSRTIRLTFTHDDIGGAVFAPMVHQAMLELIGKALRGKADNITASNGVRVMIEAPPVIAWDMAKGTEADPINHTATNGDNEFWRRFRASHMPVVYIKSEDAPHHRSMRLNPTPSPVAEMIHMERTQQAVDNKVDKAPPAQEETIVDNTTEQPVERKPVFIPGARWPDPKDHPFTTERRDPMNPANRHTALTRRTTDKDRGR